ncbi:MAG: hypothetical protein UU12_C0004G0011 [Candidatus Woesebacteria bacterium GW2011_GWA2_40_7b]|uniref:Uncharacterized protein n=1 Tax=Candidatus Woesebacteria bacterium GW2011_GWA2_40_7b TaxID=1618563 RepID=A0A0G0T2L7_9BACT|nr:MAG: hypothetical protein UU12_C0004G0011 [Candidatus Woesebacteria bacterium GW2011_GWA2_40_7b]
MLTKRTNVLLSEEDHLMLTNLAKESNKTIGELVRHAVKKTYKINKRKTKSKINKELEAAIKSGWKYLKHPEIPLDYKALIEYGRKY